MRQIETWYSARVILQFMCVGSLAGVTYLRYTVLTRSNKSKTAVYCCEPALSVLVMLVSRNVFHVVSALQSIVTVLNTVFQIFSVVTKNRCHLRHHTFQKSQKYLYSGKNTKKNLLQLRCSNVLLHFKYSPSNRPSCISSDMVSSSRAHDDITTPVA